MESIECMLGCLGGGHVVVPINWRWSIEDMLTALNSLVGGEVVQIVVDDHFKAMGQRLCEAGLQVDMLHTGHLMSLCNRPCGEDDTLRYRDVALLKALDDVAFVIFTSGTTSAPKGAMITHDAMIFQCYNKRVCCGYSSSDVYLHMAPMFHVGGLVSALAMVYVGATHVCMPEPRFDASTAVQLLHTHACTSFIAVPTMMNDLIKASVSAGRSLDRVERVLIGAGGLSDRTAQLVTTCMPRAVVYTAYGMTEACSSMTYAVLGHPTIFRAEPGHAYVGSPPRGIHMAVLTADGCIKSEGHGELVTRGRHLFLKYCMEDHRPAESFVTDHKNVTWFRTGDLGHITSTHDVWLAGRVKDMIKTGGENVSALEVESVVSTHPDIQECSVFGTPDSKWGEAVTIAVVLKEDAPLQSIQSSTHDKALNASIKAHCLSKGLSSYKIPKLIIVYPHNLPRNATGKVLKHKLRQSLLQKPVSKL